ncbi:hypothetical protein [Akkermansia phage Chantilly]|nr:hypothetical protein [Akkermansia phage Chantilly]
MGSWKGLTDSGNRTGRDISVVVLYKFGEVKAGTNKPTNNVFAYFPGGNPLRRICRVNGFFTSFFTGSLAYLSKGHGRFILLFFHYRNALMMK